MNLAIRHRNRIAVTAGGDPYFAGYARRVVHERRSRLCCATGLPNDGFFSLLEALVDTSTRFRAHASIEISHNCYACTRTYLRGTAAQTQTCANRSGGARTVL